MILWILLFQTVFRNILAQQGAARVNHADALIEWVRSKGGFFSQKIEIQHLDKTDPSSPIGGFALEKISKEEILMTIPQQCLLTSEESIENLCDSVHNLIKESKQKNESEFAPYLNYLWEERFKGHLPSSWSKAGKELLEGILGNELPPHDVADISFEDECEGSGDPFEEEAYLHMIRSGWDDIMIPVFDMLNHRNGRWHNVDSKSAHKGDDITVFAHRDIVAGEQLHLSYNECAECKNGLTYSLPHILRDHGFVEQYPQRWTFEFDDDDQLIFDLDEKSDTGNAPALVEEQELQLTWLSDEPEDYMINFLRGHLGRLLYLEEIIYERVQQLISSHEREVTIEYYQALVTALEHVIWAADTDEETSREMCTIYDDLEERSGSIEFTDHACDIGQHFHKNDYEDIDEINSYYQRIEFKHCEEIKDTCLYLSNHLESCTSNRAHYHEVFVHYPARFIDDVKRVLFIGGGDNMVLHEILKYTSLELVVGMELDQQVVRSSFEHFGTQPHWDDDRVQWWYSDAAKSLLMLPREYYGTFDLVLVDLQTPVVEFLKVTEDLGIMDAVLLLLKPDGIFVGNNDEGFGTFNHLMNYTVDLYYQDVPAFCHQGITVGSRTVDFFARTPKDHNIETLYLDPVDEMEDHFQYWYNYQKSTTVANRPCKQSSGEDKELTEQTSSLGVFMILEAEDAVMLLDSSKSVQAGISEALNKVGLTEINVTLSASKGRRDTIVFILQEGYVVARTWPGHKYCAFDILLWSGFDKQDATKNALIAAVGSKGGKSSSSYRIVTGGMFGTSSWKEDRRNLGPHVSELCEHQEYHVRNASLKQSDINTILGEVISLIQDSTVSVAVLCGEHSQPCSSLEVLEKAETVEEVIPVWSCSGIALDSVSAEDPSQRMYACENDILSGLKGSVEANGVISGIVIDPSAQRVMGQILHKILSNGRVRRELLTDDLVVLETTLDPSESWRMALLERFQTEFFVYDPAYRAEVLFNSTTSSLRLGVFSSGDDSFFSHLFDVIARIEEQTGLFSEVRKVLNGVNNYVPEFEPLQAFSHDDYDHTSSLEQWLSQQPLGQQTIFQFDAKSSDSPIEELSTNRIKEALMSALLLLRRENIGGGDIGNAELQIYDDLFDGCVIAAFWSRGSIIISWDGRTHVDMIIFTLMESRILRQKLKNYFLEDIPFLVTTARDEQPRGFGRVVNFRRDIKASICYLTPSGPFCGAGT